MKYFEDDAKRERAGGDMIIENGRQAVTISGRAEITKDRVGLAVAEQLLEHIVLLVQLLRAEDNLPETIGPAPAVQTIKNPTR